MNLFERLRAFAREDRVAIENGESFLSYKSLFENMVSWNNYLRQNLKSDAPVVIYGHKENAILPCMLGCVLSGRAYVPVDITFAQSRFEDIVALVKPEIVVNFSSQNVCENLHKDITILNSDDAENIISVCDEIDELPNITQEQLCYIIFTSGSTGTPKGVCINWRNLNSFMHNFAPIYFNEHSKEKFLNCIPYNFDLSVGNLYTCLYFGNTLYSVDKNTADNLKLLFERLETSEITTIVSTPSLVEMFISSAKFGAQLLPKLSKFIFCGETLPNKLVQTIYERFACCQVVNTYGPTEATVLVTAQLITKEMAHCERPITIGKPLSGVALKILDGNGNLAPNGTKGTLHIVGDCVSVGYFKQQQLTDKVFYKDRETGEQAYNTGDICVFENGLYYFCERLDFQIKLNGNRIELGDVENNLLKLSSVSSVAVLPIKNGEKVEYLAAFVVLSETSEIIQESNLKLQTALKKQLGHLVSPYMIPKKFVFKDSLPLNANGKVDRTALYAQLEGGRN